MDLIEFAERYSWSSETRLKSFSWNQANPLIAIETEGPAFWAKSSKQQLRLDKLYIVCEGVIDFNFHGHADPKISYLQVISEDAKLLKYGSTSSLYMSEPLSDWQFFLVNYICVCERLGMGSEALEYLNFQVDIESWQDLASRRSFCLLTGPVLLVKYCEKILKEMNLRYSVISERVKEMPLLVQMSCAWVVCEKASVRVLPWNGVPSFALERGLKFVLERGSRLFGYLGKCVV